KITVHEGGRFRWGKVSIEGDTNEVPKAELEKLLTMKPGKWYERQQMTAVLGEIQNRMGSAGYAYSEISVQPLPNAETKTVDFVLHIEPGRKIYVNEIHITGNNKTRDEVVRRELRQMESAPYDTSKLQRSKERVELLGYFDNVQFDAVPLAGTPDKVDLNMSLTERSTGSLDLSAGWVQDTGLVMSAGVSQDNLFGTGKSAALRASRSKTTLNGSLSFTDPYFTADGVSLGYDVYGKAFDPRKASTSIKQYKTTTAGAGIRMSVPVTEYDRVNFGLVAEHLTVNTYNKAPKHYAD
ncbi:outer membrane protein assembly factor BamA, partial [Corynebacterium diphtheriae]